MKRQSIHNLRIFPTQLNILLLRQRPWRTAANSVHALAQKLDVVYDYLYEARTNVLSLMKPSELPFSPMLFSLFLPILLCALCEIYDTVPHIQSVIHE